jgi:hypothetical protein
MAPESNEVTSCDLSKRARAMRASSECSVITSILDARDSVQPENDLTGHPLKLFFCKVFPKGSQRTQRSGIGRDLPLWQGFVFAS